MDGEIKVTGDALPTQGQPSGDAKGPSTPPKMYSTEEVNQRHAKLDKNLAQVTRERDQTIKERDKYKADIERLTSERDSFSTAAKELAEIKQTNEELEAERDTLAADDPQRTQLNKLLREGKAKEKAQAAWEANLAEREAKVQRFERDQLICDLAETYVTASGEETDPGALIRAIERLPEPKKGWDKASIEALAEEKGWKLKTSTATTPEMPVLDSGKTSGGSESLEGLSPRQLLVKGYSKKK